MTGIPTVLAHRLASAPLTSRPSGATVNFCWVPSEEGCVTVLALAVVLIVDSDAELALLARTVEVEPTLLGVGGGTLVSTRSDARSSLLPTRRTLSLGDARARASLRKGCIELKDLCEVMS
jgi:hypothetical protein